MKRLFALTLLMGAPSVAASQTITPPDPATVELPDLTSRDPGVSGNGWKYFYFHKQSVSYEQAYADFADCYRFLAGLEPYVRLPLFAPWKEPSAAAAGAERPPQNGGLAGALILSVVTGTLDRRARQSTLRRCMEPRGYVRYAIPENAWEQLVDRYSQRSIALQAKAASGPKPNQEPVK
jgi:hypothetical protein